MEYQRGEHRVHLLIYHLIFCPKRIKSVLVGEVATECERLIRAKCDEKGWEILSLAVMQDIDFPGVALRIGAPDFILAGIAEAGYAYVPGHKGTTVGSEDA